MVKSSSEGEKCSSFQEEPSHPLTSDFLPPDCKREKFHSSQASQFVVTHMGCTLTLHQNHGKG